MKPTHLLLFALLLFCSIELAAQQHPLVGTWEMVSGKGTDADGNQFSFNTSTVRETKIITATHYMLIAQDVREDAILFNRSLAGTVRIEGNKYVETPMFSSHEEQTKIKTDFTWRVEGDRFIQQGTIMLADGKQVTVDELVFQRVKSDKSYAHNPSIGVWDQLSSSYTLADGTRDAHTNATATRFQIITPTHWMRISHRDNKFESAMGGAYTMEVHEVLLDLETTTSGYSGNYTMKVNRILPKIDFASFPINQDEKYEFTQKLDGDKLYITGFGQGADGKKIISFEDVFQSVGSKTNKTAFNK